MEEGGRWEGQNFQQLKKVQRLEEEEEMLLYDCMSDIYYNHCMVEYFLLSQRLHKKCYICTTVRHAAMFGRCEWKGNIHISAEVVMTCIWEMLISNLNQDIHWFWQVYSGLLQSLGRYCGNTCIRSGLLHMLSSSFPDHPMTCHCMV